METIDWPVLALNVGTAAIALGAGLLAHAIMLVALQRIGSRTQSVLDRSVALHCSAPLRLIFPLLGLDVVLPSQKIPSAVAAPLRHLIALLLVGGVAALCIRTMRVVEDLLIEHFRIDVPDNLMARRVRTQFDVFRRVVSFAVFVIALGIALTTFDGRRLSALVC